MTAMTIPMRILGAAFLTACLFQTAAAFRLSGWEYATRLSNNGRPLSASDPYFIHSASLRGHAAVFFKKDGQLMVFDGQSGDGYLKSVAPVDPDTRPVIRADGDALLILVYHSGAYRVLRLRAPDAGSVQELARFSHPFGFNAELSVIGNRFVVSLPVLADGKYNLELQIFEKTGASVRRQTVSFPPLTEKEKGNFFFRMVPYRGGYQCYFIKRSYDDDRRQIGDYLYTVFVRSPEQIRTAKPSLLIPFGYSDHPPEIVRTPSRDYVLFSRKRGSAYSFRLLPMGERLEYSVSRETVNAYAPAFLVRDNALDLFFLGRNAEGTRLFYRQLDLGRLNETGYLEQRTSDRSVTALAQEVNAVSVSEDGTNSRFYFITARDGGIWTSRTDRSAPRVAVRQERRIEDGMIRPRFFWNEPDDPSGIAGYAVRVDGNPDTVPVVVNQGPGERSWDSRGLKAGEYHFHVRTVDNRGNAGPVTHVPFRVGAEVFRGFLALQNRPLSRVEETLRLLEDELALSNDYRKAEYAALLGYYRNAEREMDNHDIPMAVNWVSRAVLIDPGKLETALFLTLAEKRKADFWRRYDIAIVIAIYLTVILVLSVFYTAVNR